LRSRAERGEVFDQDLLNSVARASIDLNVSINVSSMTRTTGNPAYSGGLHSTGQAMDVSVIGGTSVSSLAAEGSTLPTTFQVAVEGYVGAALQESLGPNRFWNRSLGGLFTPSPGIFNLHQTHIHFGVRAP
jgi:hypothetical protein